MNPVAIQNGIIQKEVKQFKVNGPYAPTHNLNWKPKINYNSNPKAKPRMTILDENRMTEAENLKVLFEKSLEKKVEKDVKLRLGSLKLPENFSALGAHYIHKRMSINFHKGFIDLNPQYE